MLSLFILFQLLPVLAIASHLPPYKRHAAHDRARKNFEHVRETELIEREHHFDNRTLVERDSYTGVGTYYFTGLGACGQYSQDSDFMVAMNSAQYGGGYPGPQCFKYITIQSGSKQVGGIQVLDECPTCAYGSLDLSPGLFTQFAGTDAGTIQITWWFDGQEQTSTTPTSTYVAPTPTSTWVPPTTTSSTSEWVAPSSSSPTSTWVAPSTQSSAIPSSTSQWSQPAPTDTITSTSTSTSSAASSTITSSPVSSASHNSTNPFAVIQSDNSTTTATLPIGSDLNSTLSSATTATIGDNGSSGDVSVQIDVHSNNLELFNALAAQYGQLVVEAAGGKK
ncbi:hypothetical protein IAR55_002524 [Kwoniella newhampshirensis]|uniref:B2-aldehyde-forming enzyme n=1 Tax=Kwoniella newhampshirensis TaxID=1651941 RepID=A0AAW0Z1V4_9TREE